MVGPRRLPFFALLLVVSIATPTVADSYLIYGESGIPPATDLFVWCDTGICPLVGPEIACNNPEGGESLQLTSNDWVGFGVFHHSFQDRTAYNGGDLKFWAISSADLKVEIQCNDGGIQTYTKLLSDYGYTGALAWQEYTIPICDFFPNSTCSPTCLAEVKSGLMATIEDIGGFPLFRIDQVRWEKSNAGTHTGATPVTVQGRQILVNGEPFVMNGIAYSPLSIGEDWRGAWRDRPDRYNVDFPLMAQAGINTVRLYAPILSTAMLDAAWANGLYVVPNFGVSPAQLGCPEGKAFMELQLEDYVSKWKDHPAVLFWLVGNEVNVNLGGNDLCLDWFPQLDALAEVAHLVEGGRCSVTTATACVDDVDCPGAETCVVVGTCSTTTATVCTDASDCPGSETCNVTVDPAVHPVTTSVAGVGDMCIPGCSDDTSLPNLDIWGAQLYQGCVNSSAFVDYASYSDCDRPLVLTEFGSDAYDSRDPGEDQAYQADCLGTLLAEAQTRLAVRTASGVSSGQIVFEWADEWWKANPEADNPDNTCVEGETSWDQHDSCAGWFNGAYPDSEMQEEWWGIVTNVKRCSTTTATTCSENDDCPAGECGTVGGNNNEACHTVDDCPDPANATCINGETCDIVDEERPLRTAYTTLSSIYQLGDVCNMEVTSFDGLSGEATLSFDPAAGAADHTLYHGLLSNVGSYSYTGSIGDLGATGSGSVTLPPGSIYWVLAARNDVEGCYGLDSEGVERPSSGSVPQAANRNCQTCVAP